MKDFHGTEVEVGDRIIPLGIQYGVPVSLASSPATVVGFGRTRIRVRFDSEVYGGRWPEYRAIGTYVRVVSS